MRALPLVLLAAAACTPPSLDGFFYDPLKAPPGPYNLSFDIIPMPEPLSVTTPDGMALDGVFIPSSGRRPDITVIYFHGQSSNRGTSWQRLEYLYPLGYNLVLVDPRGYGKSTGTPTEAGLQIDERAILEAVLAHAGVVANHLVFYGRSLGSGLAIDLAFQKVTTPPAPPAVLITESAFASVASFVNDATYVDFPSSFVSNSSWDNLAKIRSVTAPYLLFHGTADLYVDPRYSQELFDAHEGLTQLIKVPGADHDDVPEKMGLDGYRAAIQDFVETQLPP